MANDLFVLGRGEKEGGSDWARERCIIDRGREVGEEEEGKGRGEREGVNVLREGWESQ